MGVQKIGQMELEARMLTFWGIKGQEMGFGGLGALAFLCSPFLLCPSLSPSCPWPGVVPTLPRWVLGFTSGSLGESDCAAC